MDSSLITFLRLAFPPFSNQEGEWMRTHPVREELGHSKLYMIVQRKAVKFINFDRPFIDGVITFDLKSGEDLIEGVTLDCAQFADEGEEIEVDIHIQREVLAVRDANGVVLYAGTPMKIMHDYWRGDVAFGGLSRFRQFTEFELLYVGISKKEDSFTRLFERGHKSRLAILSNETQMVREARLTDELYMLLFYTEDIGIRSASYGDDLDFEKMNAPTPPKIKQVADAEKAFVRMLNTKYNTVTYPNFPRGKDGLYRERLSRYAFAIDDEIILNAGPNRFRSVATKNMKPWHQGDFIFVKGEDVEIVRPMSRPPRGRKKK